MGVVLWGVSLLISLLQAIARILSISRELKELGIHSPSRVSSEGSATAGLKRRVTFEDQQTGSNKTCIRVLRHQRFVAMLTVVQTLSDLMNAVHWMPKGFLWAGHLTNFWVGFFGTVSSLIGLYKILPVRPSLAIWECQTTGSLCLLFYRIHCYNGVAYNIVHSYSLMYMCKLVGVHNFIQLQNPHGWTQV